jgi:hypothetical protein
MKSQLAKIGNTEMTEFSRLCVTFIATYSDGYARCTLQKRKGRGCSAAHRPRADQ